MNITPGVEAKAQRKRPTLSFGGTWTKMEVMIGESAMEAAQLWWVVNGLPISGSDPTLKCSKDLVPKSQTGN